MSFLRRLWHWLRAPSLDKLLVRCLRYGTVVLQDMGGSKQYGEITWQCTVRPHSRASRGPMNSWTGSGGSPTDAVLDALAEIDANPSFVNIEGNYAPKLGGREFDPE